MSTRCSATTTAGNPCRRWAIAGGTVCPKHGGAAPQVRQKAAERVLEMRLNGELRRRGWQPVTNPVLWYQEVAGEVRAFLELCRESMAALDALAYTDGRGVEDVRALLALYERALDRAQRTADQMTARGIEAKVLDQASAQAEAIVKFGRDAIAIARREPNAAPDAILLRLLPEAS